MVRRHPRMIRYRRTFIQGRNIPLYPRSCRDENITGRFHVGIGDVHEGGALANLKPE